MQKHQNVIALPRSQASPASSPVVVPFPQSRRTNGTAHTILRVVRTVERVSERTEVRLEVSRRWAPR